MPRQGKRGKSGETAALTLGLGVNKFHLNSSLLNISKNATFCEKSAVARHSCFCDLKEEILIAYYRPNPN